MVMTLIAAVICFFVSLVFMVVFDSIADTIFLCMAKETDRYGNWKSTNAGSFKAPKKEKPNMCTSFFSLKQPEAEKWEAPSINRQTAYANKQLEALVPDRWN